MEKIIVRGGNKLQGTVKVEGAKNAVLPVIAATLLASKGTSTLRNVPQLSDVYTINEVLKYLKADVSFENDVVTVNATGDILSDTPFEYVRKMRASIVVMGPLLARTGSARVALPGGCAIGSRPVDLHLKGFEAMGANVRIENGYIEATAKKLIGAKIYLDFPSVGATQNIMMAATLAEGTTVIENVAREPEIVDLANFLNQMGARVIGAGTEVIRIEGVKELTATDHSIIPDRIEAGTFMIAAAITEGNVLIEDMVPEHISSLIAKLEEMGVQIIEENNGVRVIGPKNLKAVDVKTLPHPGFPTDMQSQMMVIQMLSTGTSVMTETVFENRFMHVEEMRRMNADMKIEGHSVIISGPAKLQGAEVAATDLRAAAALVLAGLVADGYTQVTELKYLDRGYHNFHIKLKALGADIERTPNIEKANLNVTTK
ncbi:UDP-N-acetylglucosamine 1-carboxyvinyltransferase [Listeria rocourtiae]|uniref:UDP-N-acetylglucosamine 1-carboxyvinyltransferase n=1 Tax=Listeria rocourtiae TaxID=647910 RepID=UPI001627411B|nr:UDP-N-acetylglucosamine 1-carboxyvinyltransferase [Listeria rocourtiae]MBC1433896.1 UDP-N-acetylglucosamine 1-carboxyvinyltransferase [Listeria rocourtiae]